MGIDISLADYILVSIGVAVGALAQGAVGFGISLVAAPVLAVVAPEALPGVMILLPVPLQAAMVRHERDRVAWSDVGWVTLGQAPGVAVGTWVVTAIALDTLSVLTGVVVLAGVATSLAARSVPSDRTSQLTAGVLSGVMGTSTSIGGPPLALLYQHHHGSVLRPTLAACFLAGTVLSVPSLALAGVMEWWHLRLAAALLPALFLGLGLSRVVAERLDGPKLRPLVLALASAAAGIAIVRGIG